MVNQVSMADFTQVLAVRQMLEVEAVGFAVCHKDRAQDGADADLLADEIDEGRAGTTMIENFLAICRRKPPETRE